MKRDIITIIIALVVGIGILTYSNVASWQKLGTEYYYYKSESSLTNEQYNDLTAYQLGDKISVSSVDKDIVRISYEFVSKDKIDYLQQSEPSLWKILNSSALDNPVISIVITLLSILGVTYVVARRSIGNG